MFDDYDNQTWQLTILYKCVFVHGNITELNGQICSKPCVITRGCLGYSYSDKPIDPDSMLYI